MRDLFTCERLEPHSRRVSAIDSFGLFLLRAIRSVTLVGAMEDPLVRFRLPPEEQDEVVERLGGQALDSLVTLGGWLEDPAPLLTIFREDMKAGDKDLRRRAVGVFGELARQWGGTRHPCWRTCSRKTHVPNRGRNEVHQA
ncbi:MAG: hypothetical protein ACE5R6_16155 [Candidatus Heimdallarchaeota archaeon]